jgi:hypothetical protein
MDIELIWVRGEAKYSCEVWTDFVDSSPTGKSPPVKPGASRPKSASVNDERQSNFYWIAAEACSYND